MMLNSTLRSVAAGTAIFGLSVMGWFTLSNQESEAYSPRLEEKAAEPNGALEIRQALLGDENGVVDYAGLAELRQKVEKKAKRDLAAKASSLSCGTNSDQTTSVDGAIEPFGANGLYAGSVSGGLWKSMNRGDNWTQITTFPQLDGGIHRAGRATATSTWAQAPRGKALPVRAILDSAARASGVPQTQARLGSRCQDLAASRRRTR